MESICQQITGSQCRCARLYVKENICQVLLPKLPVICCINMVCAHTQLRYGCYIYACCNHHQTPSGGDCTDARQCHNVNKRIHVLVYISHRELCTMQEEQKFLQQRVECLQKELEVFAERSKQEVEQLRAELNSTQQVCTSLCYSACCAAQCNKSWHGFVCSICMPVWGPCGVHGSLSRSYCNGRLDV